MGILKNFEGEGHDEECIDSVPHIEQLLTTTHLTDGSSSSEDDEMDLGTTVPAPSDVHSSVLTTVRPPKVKKSVSKMPKPMIHVKSIGGKKSQGNREARRHENMCFLLNLARDLDEDFAAVNIHDLVETTVSAFAQLLLNKSQMKIWNEFAELPEAQQETLVKMIAEKRQKRKSRRDKKAQRFNHGSVSNSSDDGSDKFVLIESSATTQENHRVHSRCRQEEADVCFRRIDANIRCTLKSMLRRHHLPLDRVIWFEDDVIPFFREHSDSVYLRDLSQSFDRLLLHAVCQYLNLVSKSFTRDGERYTQVENRRVEFAPPVMLLSDYMKRLDGSANGGI